MSILRLTTSSTGNEGNGVVQAAILGHCRRVGRVAASFFAVSEENIFASVVVAQIIVRRGTQN
jgi:hypothetical protein